MAQWLRWTLFEFDVEGPVVVRKGSDMRYVDVDLETTLLAELFRC